MSITEQILSAIIKERENDINHFRALLKEEQDYSMRLRQAGEDVIVAWAKVRTEKDYHAWKDATSKWDAVKDGEQS